MESLEVLEKPNNPNKYDMNIAHFCWEFPPIIWGGLGTFASEISKKQISMGNEVTVFAINEKNEPPKLDNYNGVNVFRPQKIDLSNSFFPIANEDLQSWGKNFKFFSDVLSYNLLSANHLIENLVRNSGKNFDIIDGHDWLGVIGGMIVKKELGLPLIFHVHSTEVGRSVGGGSKTIKQIEHEAGLFADCVITVSYSMKDELVKLGFPEDKIKVCWNGIDPKKYDPAKIKNKDKSNLRKSYGIKDKEHLLFFIGRLVTVKGAENLVKAIPEVLEEYPNTKLLILGVGDLENKIKTMIEELDISKNVVLRTEFISEEERILHYASADSVVLPSLYEPFGIVCTEAMSMEKPVIVGANGTSGMREQIIPEGEKQCGIHINPNEPQDIAWGIKQVLESPDRSSFMAKNARERAINQFSWNTVAKKTLDIYKEVINNRKS